MEPVFGRKLVTDKAPNRLFLKYLAEWRDEAREKGDKSAFTYGKAHKSLMRYPLPLQCGGEAKILENFGDKISKMLDDKLGKDAEENNMTPSEYLEKSRKVPASWWEMVKNKAPVATKKPARRRKAEKDENTAEAKKKPQSKTILDMLGVTGKEGTEQSIVESNPQKEMIKPKTLGSIGDNVEAFGNGDIVFGGSSTMLSQDPQFVLSPGQFDVVLCVDSREIMGESRPKAIGVELNKQNVCYEQRTLHIGDFLWVAQQKPRFCVGHKPKELVLDYIIERKILSDLSMSIRDGRFREQKIRLKNSGIGNVIYLIENMKDIENQSMPEQTLRQAIYNTQIVDEICVKYTNNCRATVQYLNLMTKRLQKLYENSTLKAVETSDSQQGTPQSRVHKLTPFETFNEMGSKHKKLTVKEMFLRQLMQIHGMSYDKASAITSTYDTPLSLIKKYRNLGSVKETEELLSKIKFGLTGRNLGIAMSRVVCKMYSD